MTKIKNLFCGIGESKINENEIEISDYPFEPSIAYPRKIIKAKEIDFINVDFGVCKIYVAEDLVFISAERKEELKEFAENNNIKLIENGIVESEVGQIRPRLETVSYTHLTLPTTPYV